MFNDDGSFTLKLKKKVVLGSEEFTELRVREPIAKDLRRLPANAGTGDILDLAARLCNQPSAVIDLLGMADTQKLLKLVGDFIEPGQETGETGLEP